MNKRLAMTLAVLVLLGQAPVIRANPLWQQQQQTPPVPTGLALEVTYDKAKAPTYASVPGPDAKLSGAWYAAFDRVASWQPPASFLPVQAVNVLSRLEDGLVRIEVSVYLGVKHFEKEQSVASHRVRENEKISVEGLRQFGVEPFKIKVVRVAPLFTNTPLVTNKTESIEIIGVKANNSTLPSYTMTVHNRSPKRVAALALSVLVNGKNQISSIRRRRDGRTFIDASATEDIFVLGAKTTHVTSAGYSPDSPPNQEILIKTAVFEDGSYEGEVEIAAQVRGFELGSKLQVPRLIALLQEAGNSVDRSVATLLSRLKTKATSLSTTVAVETLQDLLNEFPSLGEEKKADLKTSIEVSLAGEKFDFLKRIEEFEKSSAQSTDPQAFRAWLNVSKERYEKWLSQLQSE